MQKHYSLFLTYFLFNFYNTSFAAGSIKQSLNMWCYFQQLQEKQGVLCSFRKAGQSLKSSVLAGYFWPQQQQKRSQTKKNNQKNQTTN